MQKVKIAVIGVGHLGSIHARLVAINPLAELVGVRDVLPERAAASAEENGCAVFDSLEAAIEASDALIIAVPTSIHHDIAIPAINRGKHCFIEKPITDTYTNAQVLIDSAKNNNVLVQVGHVERFNPALAAIKDRRVEPIFIEAHRLGQFKPRARDVSVIHDLMIHDIDIVLWLVKSKVAKVDSNGVAVLTDTTDIANARITFENGTVANLTASRISANPMRKMRIFQKDAYFSIDFAEHTVEIYSILDEGATADGMTYAAMLGSIETGTRNRNIYYEKPPVPRLNAIGEEQTAFLKSILNAEKISVTAEEAAEAIRIAEMILK